MGLINFSLSPSVNVYEYDLTIGVPLVSTSITAVAGVFRWGPLNERVVVPNEPTLVSYFAQPTNFNGETFFTAANFLAYGDQLYVSRAANTAGPSPIVDATVDAGNNILIVPSTTNPNLIPGMIAAHVNNGHLATGAVIANIINSTAVHLTSASFALSDGLTQVQWMANNCAYSALGNIATIANLAQNIVRNEADFPNQQGTFDPDLIFLARYPGALGNSLRVTLCDSPNAFSNTFDLTAIGNGGAEVVLNVASNTATVTIHYGYVGPTTAGEAVTAVNAAANAFQHLFNINDLILFGNSSVGTQALRLLEQTAWESTSNATEATATFDWVFDEDLALYADQNLSDNVSRFWEFFALAQQPPGQTNWQLFNGNGAALDGLHVFVIDEGGMFTGIPGTILERYLDVSRSTDAMTVDGNPNFYMDIINQRSNYIWATNPRSFGYVNTGINLASTTNDTPLDMVLQLGADGADEQTVSIASLANAYSEYLSPEVVDVDLILQGKARGGLNQTQLFQWLLDNLAYTRLDVVVFGSPDKTDLVNVSTDNDRIQFLLDYRNDLDSTSYGFLDGNYKYQYDKYNNVYRWVPFNGDMAGLAARTDQQRAPWWSFAGYNRGIIKNVSGLAWNPLKPYRDILYPNCINPIVHKNGIGNLLFGDKTLLEANSAFSRINVRRLFIFLEKAISSLAKYFLFEFNDSYTRALFTNAITPELRAVKAARGIQDFDVICDESNNGPDVVDAWTMNGDIYIKPARDINWINLNFIAVRSGVTFSEVIGTAY